MLILLVQNLKEILISLCFHTLIITFEGVNNIKRKQINDYTVELILLLDVSQNRC